MGVKRKASFTTIASPKGTSCCPETIVTIDETPKHLHSRTRKRFRDDRPDDETIYGEADPLAILITKLLIQICLTVRAENTIRLLFSAQKSLSSSLSSPDESTTLGSPPPSPEPMDPRQLTLRQFFQPSRVSHTSIQIKCMPLTPESPSTFKVENIHCRAIDDLGKGCSESDSDNSHSGEMEMDADINMKLNLKGQGLTTMPKR